MVENPRLILGLKVRTLRQERGETLQSLAERSGLSVSYLSEIEKGKKYPKPERLLQLAAALEVPFDELVSLHVGQELSGLKVAFNSQLLREFPLELFGLEPQDLLALVSGDPERGSALLRAIAEVGRSYDVHVEHFLLAALRAYQQLHANYFDDLEVAVREFREHVGWNADRPLSIDELASVLCSKWSYTIDEVALKRSADLGSFRSVYAAGDRPTLYVNPRLMPSQTAFVLAREIGFCHLGLQERAPSSPWLSVESFDQVFNNFQASYFAGALLIDGQSMRQDLEELFAMEHWRSAPFEALMARYGATPETVLHRLTQIAPRYFGFAEFFFLRFSSDTTLARPLLTKWLNTSKVAVPRGFGLSESFCRRWPAFKLLGDANELSTPREHLVSAERIRFIDDGEEFLQLSTARPLALGTGAISVISVGLRADVALRRRVRFWNDDALSRVDVNLTCERCQVSDCDERVAPSLILDQADERMRKAEAVRDLAPAQA